MWSYVDSNLQEAKHAIQAATYEDKDGNEEHYFSNTKESENSVQLELWTTIFKPFSISSTWSDAFRRCRLMSEINAVPENLCSFEIPENENLQKPCTTEIIFLRSFFPQASFYLHITPSYNKQNVTLRVCQHKRTVLSKMWYSYRKRDEMILELISFPTKYFGQIYRRRWKKRINCLKPDLYPNLIEKFVRTSQRTHTFNSSPLSCVTAHLYWVIVFRRFGTE